MNNRYPQQIKTYVQIISCTGIGLVISAQRDSTMSTNSENLRDIKAADFFNEDI